MRKLDSARLMEGQARALRGIEWPLVDAMAKGHRKISAPVLLIWGEDDPTFPIEGARQMARQFPNCHGLHPVPKTKLLVHEEAPKAVATLLLEFFEIEASRHEAKRNIPGE